MKTSELFRQLEPDYSPSNDPWGYAMGLFFDVAGELYNRGEAVPDEWQFRPGACGVVEISDYRVDELDEAATADLLRLGAFLHRLTGRIDRAGLSY